MAADRRGAGRLDQRVTISGPVRLPDGGGGFVMTWAPVAQVWAEIWPVSGMERAAHAQGLAGEAATSLYRARIRAMAGVTTAMRLEWRDTGMLFNIRAVALAGRTPMMVLDLESGVAL